jgi:hypothetical protein
VERITLAQNRGQWPALVHNFGLHKDADGTVFEGRINMQQRKVSEFPSGNSESKNVHRRWTRFRISKNINDKLHQVEQYNNNNNNNNNMRKNTHTRTSNHRIAATVYILGTCFV